MERQGGNQLLLAMIDDAVVGCLQLTFIAGISRLGMTRAQIEGVRVDEKLRGAGIGRALFERAITLSREAQCGLVQLTTDKQRPEALKFYESLGLRSEPRGDEADALGRRERCARTIGSVRQPEVSKISIGHSPA